MSCLSWFNPKKTKTIASLAAASLLWQSILSPALSIYAATNPNSDPSSLDDDDLWLDSSYSIEVQSTSKGVATPILARATGYVEELHRIPQSTYDLTSIVPNWKTQLGIPKLKASLGGNSYAVFCIEPGVIHEKGGNMEAQDYYHQLTADQKHLIDLALMYGYQNNGDTSDDSYVATQVVIWEIVTKTPYWDKIWGQLIEKYPKRDKIYNQIWASIDTHEVRPSFHNTTQTLTWDESRYYGSVSDTNQVLDKYQPIRKKTINLISTLDETPKLTMSTPLSNLDETIELVKQAKYGGLTMYWIGQKQNLVSGGQGTPVYARLGVKTPALGTLTIQKVGPHGERIPDVIFNIQGPNGYNQNIKTTANGVIALGNVSGGTYTVTEVSVPAPYLLNSKPQTQTIQQGESLVFQFENGVPSGKIDIYKTGEQLSKVNAVNGGYDFVYEQLPLANTVFDVYAKETIKNSAGAILHEKDAHVGRLTTDQNGKASLNNLPLGTYTLKEVQAPAGLVVSTQTHDFTLSYQNSSTSLVSATKTIENVRQTVQLSLSKVGEQADGSFKPLEGVSFGIYTKNDILARGDVAVKAGSLVHTFKTKADGTASVSIQLPVGSYWVQEIAAPDQYIVSDEQFAFDFKGDSQQALSVQVNVNDGKVITNYLSRGTLQLIKQNNKQEPLAGAIFDLYTKEDILIGTYTTNGSGQINVSDLIYGDYYMIERQAPSGYRLSDEKINFSIRKNQEVIKQTAINQPTRVEISKVNTDGKALAGATLQLLTKDNKLVSEWVSTTEAKVFENLAHGTYTLKETKAPSGYQQFEPITFDVTDANQVVKVTAIDEETQVEFSKIDHLGNWVEGAHLQLLDQEKNVLTEWMSGTESLKLTGLPHGTYTIHEKSAPSGYLLADDLTFTVTDARGTQSLKMVDEPTVIHVQKVTDKGQPLAGATLQLVAIKNSLADVPTTMLPEETLRSMNESHEVIIDEWFTTGEPRTFEGLPHGEYFIREVGTPLGYQSTQDIAFTVSQTSKEISIDVVNRPTEVQITKYDEEGNKLFGATMQILNAEGEVLEEWETSDQTKVIEGLIPGSYILREITAPDTFKKILDVPFEVTNEEKVHVLEVTDELTKTIIHKVDEKGRYINGAHLQILNEAGEVVREWETTRESFTIAGLSHGDYTLHEVKAPKGYLVAEDIKFAVTDTPEDLELTMVDKFDPELGALPETGFGIFQSILFASLGLAASVGAVYWVKRQAKQ